MIEQVGDRAAMQMRDVGVVVIGRNEGARLVACLQSVRGQTTAVIYVDSGSTDGSPTTAKALDCHVVVLDLTTPFTAARARNAGFAALRSVASDVVFVQFVDGDCEVAAGWIATARDFLVANTQAAVVFGRRRERFPGKTIYNALCDEEWAVAVGVKKACGGDAMIRASALVAVGGYRDGMIAGEEPELCVRFRRSGHTIFCLAHEMTLHDAAMVRFGQWWRRAVRSGHAFAEGKHLHGAPPERHWVRECRRILMWGAAIPASIAIATASLGVIGLAGLVVYPAQVVRLYVRRRAHSSVPFRASVFQVVGNLPEVWGLIQFHINRLRGQTRPLIEYK
jgi:GT2 family glycosyltransferase